VHNKGRQVLTTRAEAGEVGQVLLHLISPEFLEDGLDGVRGVRRRESSWMECVRGRRSVGALCPTGLSTKFRVRSKVLVLRAECPGKHDKGPGRQDATYMSMNLTPSALS
jgi:hypothetical protein